MRSSTRTLLLGLIFPIGGLILWEAAIFLAASRSESIAKPSEIVTALAEILGDGSLANAAAETFSAALGGLAIGGALGILAGLVLGLYPAINRLTEIPYETLRPVPSVALIPLSLLTFGFGLRMEVAVVSFSCFWPTSIYTAAAVREIEPRLLEVSRILGLGPFKHIYSVVLPACLPRVFVGVRVAAAVALIVAVTVEVSANPRGLGYAMIIAQQSIRADTTFAFLIAIGALGWALNYSLLAAQRRLFPAISLAGQQELAR